ncbi:MAG: GNAT family N-acetyltransferase [Spirochaetaceae bacterium]|nr:GNAT family N-acetyltransferase [Spirochaetaceae bacterium]
MNSTYSILKSKPLLLRACEAGHFGKNHVYGNCSIAEALFTYLSGEPNEALINQLCTPKCGRHLVCLSEQWASFIRQNFPDAETYVRYQMKSVAHFVFPDLGGLSSEFEVQKFGEKEFEAKPFSHGMNYKSAEDFAANGAGAVIRYDGKIVSSASSFLSFKNEVELDFSTLEDYRRKGLANHCINEMLKDCETRGLLVHWDAQTEISRNIAIKFGFELNQSYTVYIV